MAKQTFQYRFKTGNSDNISEDSWRTIVSGSAFADKFGKGVEQLGIQAIPGTKFKLNSSPNWVIIGSTGIYELDLTNRATITSLVFDAESVYNIKEGSGLSLLVDIVYQGDD